MFFPIGDTNIYKGSKPIVTHVLILANVFIFLYQFFLPPVLRQELVLTYGTIPVKIIHGLDAYTLITSMFLHGGWMHLLGNMMFLWVFADNIEATIGSFRFAVFYLVSGILAGLVHCFSDPYSMIPGIGASGAIAACLGAYLVMFPHSRIRVMILFFFITFQVPAFFFLGFWILQQFLNGIGSLHVSSLEGDGVAYWAHIGGFVSGVLAGFLFKKKASGMHLTDG